MASFIEGCSGKSVVWKFEMPALGEIGKVMLPSMSRIVHIGAQNGKPFAWLLCDSESEPRPFVFATHATGEATVGTYLGTAVDDKSGLVFHVFKVA